MEEKPLDMNNREIEIGDVVKVYSLIGKDNIHISKVVGVGKVYCLHGIHLVLKVRIAQPE